jgi:hypothetical protein
MTFSQKMILDVVGGKSDHHLHHQVVIQGYQLYIFIINMLIVSSLTIG